VKRDRTMKKRQQLARRVERAAVPERPYIGRGLRYLVEPNISTACAPSLRAIAAALRDETHPIDDASLNSVGRFLTGGAGSPFFGRDSTAALREVVRLQHVVVGAEKAAFDEDQLIMTVVAVVTDRTDTLAVAEAALEEASATGARLIALGSVTPRFYAPQPACGERVRQHTLVSHNVDRVLAQARERGVAATSVVVLGRPLEAGLQEAEARGATALFVPRPPALFRRNASIRVERVELFARSGQPEERLAA
jgi:Universal stress protein family